MECYVLLRYPQDEYGYRIGANCIRIESLSCTKEFLRGVVVTGHWIFGFYGFMSGIDIVDSKGKIISDISDMVPSWIDGFDLREYCDASMENWSNKTLCTHIAAKFPRKPHEFYYPSATDPTRWFRVPISHIDTFLGMSWAMKFFGGSEGAQGFLFRGGIIEPDGMEFPHICAAARVVEEFFANFRYLSRDPVSVVKSFMLQPLQH